MFVLAKGSDIAELSLVEMGSRRVRWWIHLVVKSVWESGFLILEGWLVVSTVRERDDQKGVADLGAVISGREMARVFEVRLIRKEKGGIDPEERTGYHPTVRIKEERSLTQAWWIQKIVFRVEEGREDVL